MTLDLLDLLIVARVCFERHVPWWLWVLGAFATVTSNQRILKMDKMVAKLVGKR